MSTLSVGNIWLMRYRKFLYLFQFDIFLILFYSWRKIPHSSNDTGDKFMYKLKIVHLKTNYRTYNKYMLMKLVNNIYNYEVWNTKICGHVYSLINDISPVKCFGFISKMYSIYNIINCLMIFKIRKFKTMQYIYIFTYRKIFNLFYMIAENYHKHNNTNMYIYDIEIKQMLLRSIVGILQL